VTPTAKLTVPLLDLKAQYEPLREEILREVTRVLDSQRWVLGPEVEALEGELAPYCGTGFAIGCANGSDALFLALVALDITPGDRVLTTPFTFFATAGAISRAGAIPVFADIDPATYNLDPSLAAEALRKNGPIKALLPVHLYGGAADMDPLLDAARTAQVPVIEDAAQAIGSEYKGRRAGSMGQIGCFSFYPTKNLGAAGDAGLLTTSDPALASKLKALREHGGRARYFHDWIGINSRLDGVQAAVLRVKAKYLDSWSEARGRNVALYRELLDGSGVVLSRAAEFQTRHIWNQFVIRVPDRDGLKKFLADHGIGTEIYYPVPLHLQKCYASLGYRGGDFPQSEKAAREVLALPIYPELTREQIEYVAHTIRSF
jgi:dTDP-4-amino-4,6-dideoxygalactose transaminase